MTMTTFLKTHKRKWLALLLGASVIAVAVILFPRSSTPATSAVSWTPASVNQTILAGDTIPISVSFTALRNLHDVVVRIVPELEPFVTVNPVALGDVIAGETVALEINILASSTTLPDTFDGVIQLTRASNPNKHFSPSFPITVTVEWPEFVTEDLGYMVSYPPLYSPTAVTKARVLFSAINVSGEGDFRAPIEFFLLPVSIASHLVAVRELFESGFLEEIVMIDTMNATRISGTLKENVFGWGSHHHTYILLPLNGSVLQMDYNSEDETVSELFDEMLSTLVVF